jgi:integration host factor subunit alpha
MTKNDLADQLYARLPELSKKQTQEIVDAVFESMKELIVKEGRLLVSSFGRFKVARKAARTGVNPVTREPMQIQARRVLTFRPSPVLREALNGG